MSSNATPAHWAGIISALAAVMTLLAGGLWYVARLDARIHRVEVAVEPIRPAASRDKRVLTCGELAAQVSDAYRSGDGSTVAAPLERLMDRLSCGAGSSPERASLPPR